MIQKLENSFGHKSLAFLGFGREGRSSYTLFRKVFPQKVFTIIDENQNIRNDEQLLTDPNLQFITGQDCMQAIDNFDIAIKSPGIPSNSFSSDLKHVNITSQTDIFLNLLGHQVIGVTGTKGKSTTSSLIYHILKNAKTDTLLVGNIGIPPFDCIERISRDTVVVMELSSHQLEYVTHAPHIAILLNLFQEHLDHYHSYRDYQLAKFNIGKFQQKEDYFIYNLDNEAIRELLPELTDSGHIRLPFSLENNVNAKISLKDCRIELKIGSQTKKLYDSTSGQPLKGMHNMYNIMTAATACFLAGVSPEKISAGIRSFKGLEHRIELVGTYAGIVWYNDSIATIPEACIEAVKTLKEVDTLILGGFDRGIDYRILYPFLNSSGISNIIYIGEAGSRIYREIKQYGTRDIVFSKADNFHDVIARACELTKKGKICLLSPAAASYDMFRNFEERGKVYKKNVRELGPSQD